MSLVMMAPPHERDPNDVRGILLDKLRSLAKPGGVVTSDASSFHDLGMLCRDVLAGLGKVGDPWSGTWVYVASLGSFAAAHEPWVREQDADLANLRL